MRPERNSQEQPWDKVLLPHLRMHRTLSLSYFADNETPSRWEKLRCAAHKHVNSQPVKPENVDSYLPYHQPIRKMSMS